jgi:heterodisulfide reductase subunit A-like polyferredoxin
MATHTCENCGACLSIEMVDQVQKQKNLITTADLNTLLKEETLSSYFNQKPDPKIAFIQCVGSRNREQG